LAQSPLADGLFMPAEWEPHGRCWMAWPCRLELWGSGLMAAQVAYAGVARAISQFEPVTMIVPPGTEREAGLTCGRSVDIVAEPIDDSWTRDTGPSFVVDGEGGVAAVHWQFNGWGNKYHDHDRDRLLGRRIAEWLDMPIYEAPIVAEAGAFHVDGHGTLMATEQCLFNTNRNPLLSGREIEQQLTQYLGVSRFLWLGEGLVDDETDGHVDNVACFVRPGVVALAMPADQSDPNWPILQDSLVRLNASKDAAGRAIEVVEIPHPAHLAGDDGRALARSYVNFYIANGGVVMPSFGDPADEPARQAVVSLFPDRKVVQVPAGDIVKGGGGIHCITQQQPAGQPWPAPGG